MQDEERLGEEILGLEVMDRMRREETEKKYTSSSKINVGSSSGGQIYKINSETGRWDLSD